MKYDTPAKFSQALLEKMRGLSAELGPVNRQKKVLAMDRLALRLSESFPGFLLKGGLAVEYRTSRARATKDLDALIPDLSLPLLETIRQAAALDLNDYFSFTVTESKKQSTTQFDGQRFDVSSFIGTKSFEKFGLDISVQDAVSGNPYPINSRDLSWAGVDTKKIPVLPIATHVSEKLHALTMPREKPNSRLKDLEPRLKTCAPSVRVL